MRGRRLLWRLRRAWARIVGSWAVLRGRAEVAYEPPPFLRTGALTRRELEPLLRELGAVLVTLRNMAAFSPGGPRYDWDRLASTVSKLHDELARRMRLDLRVVPALTLARRLTEVLGDDPEVQKALGNLDDLLVEVREEGWS